MKTIRTAKLGDVKLRLVEKDKLFIGLVFSGGPAKVRIEGTSADDVWRRLHDEAGKANPKYFGFDGARARFLHFFPHGFHAVSYEGQERNYKVGAKSTLDETVPLEKAADGSGYAEAGPGCLPDQSAFAVREDARSGCATQCDCDDFIRAAARFTMDDGKQALAAMKAALKPHNAAKWTTVTYLSFLPKIAARVGHRFASDYEPRLDIAVYDSLLNLTKTATEEISDLASRPDRRPKFHLGCRQLTRTILSDQSPERTAARNFLI